MPALETVMDSRLVEPMFTAFACGTRTVFREMSVPDKSNETPAVPLLLQMLDLVNATVTLDAMHCQVETAQAVLDRGRITSSP